MGAGCGTIRYSKKGGPDNGRRQDSAAVLHPTGENINRWTELLAQAGYSEVTVAHTYRNARRLIKFSGSRIVICTVPDNYGLVLSLINRELTGSTFRAPADFCCICERSSRAEKVLRYCSTVYGVRLISSADQPLALCDRLEEILQAPAEQ